MNSSELRKKFLNYFETNGHRILPSSSVVPHDDPSLLFINAGMNQFKDIFLGKGKRDYTRATTSQKCIRVGGKHNDLENVGHTTRHLTFFEMLGNFSFGDYFKQEAIRFSWELSTEILEFDPDRIWPSVFEEDDESFELWKQFVPEERIVRFGESENFWAMGDTGPCGPCSELLYDRGPSYGSGVTPHDDPSGERFPEFWNLVFMQYNTQASGERTPLPKPSIDTGMGLERVLCFKHGFDSVFETDVLRGLIAQVENLSGVKYDPSCHDQAAAFRVIADHLRAVSFAIADGAQPSNLDRGYVLRKILRRAVRYGKMLGFEEPFLAKVVPTLIGSMGEDYTELKESEARIEEILTVEEESFHRTLKRGGNLLSQIMHSAHEHGNQISGDDAFKLKDTYGLPYEEILLLAKDEGLSVDKVRYKELEEDARERSKQAQKNSSQVAEENLFETYLEKHSPCHFVGYTQTESSSEVTSILVDHEFVDQMTEGQEGALILNSTPFYAEKGGQVGDQGIIFGQGHSFEFEVSDTQNPFHGVVVHYGTLKKGSLKVNDPVTARINKERRQNIQNNHTATHLLHWALQKVLGTHIKQSGSVVDPNRLRFDFTHHKGLTKDEIQEIERLVNAKIRGLQAVEDYEIDYSEAQKRSDIKQFFGEKYLSQVRVIDLDYSKELCGGTHTHNVGTIGLFRITSEGSIAAGIRRIVAVTGRNAEDYCYENDQLIEEIADSIGSKPGKLKQSVQSLIEENKKIALELKQLKKKEAGQLADQLLSKKEQVGQTPLIAVEVSVEAKELKTLADSIMKEMKSGVLLLANKTDPEKCSLLCRVSDDLVDQVNAGSIIKEISPIINGSGGGKAGSAQAGGTSPDKIPEALEKARTLL